MCVGGGGGGGWGGQGTGDGRYTVREAARVRQVGMEGKESRMSPDSFL